MDFLSPVHDQVIHLQIQHEGVCPSCHKKTNRIARDFGTCTVREIDALLEAANISIEPIHCKHCDIEWIPSHQIVQDPHNQITLSKEIFGVDIPVFHAGQVSAYGMTFSDEDFEIMQAAVKQQGSYYEESKEEFWEKYTEYALEHWNVMVREVLKMEFYSFYQSKGIQLRPTTSKQTTEQMYVQDFLRRYRSEAEKRKAWRELNDPLVRDYIANLGPQCWNPKKDMKHYGVHRTRFMILHAHIPEALEVLRTHVLPNILQKSAHTDMLILRLKQQGEQLQRTYQKVTDWRKRHETLLAEHHKQQAQLAHTYQLLREAEGKQVVTDRDPKDIRKLHAQKELIRELKEENKSLRISLSSYQIENKLEAAELFAEEQDMLPAQDILEHVLGGKTVGIIGGRRKEQASSLPFPCDILTHTGEVLDPDFFRLLRRSDVAIFLTEHASHESMWEAKSWFTEEGKPIFFLKGVNLTRLLTEAAEKLLQHSSAETI